MYRLTVVENAHTATSEHPDEYGAHCALIEYVIGANYYLERIQAGCPHTSYDLLDLGEYVDHNDRRPTVITEPRTVGQAVIEELAESTHAADSPYYVAAAAQRWISDYQALSNSGSPSDGGTRYALTVLAYAQAEARCWFSAGALLREAAHQAGVEPIVDPHQPTLEALRDNASRTLHSEMCPAELAGAVKEMLSPGTPTAHVATFIWWLALLAWGRAGS